MKAKQIRSLFVQYFEKHGHTHVASSSLIPHGDDTLLFTNAGMNQFKNLFLGLEKRDYKRAVSFQKCVRAGGKHNDLENVGHTARHHTFFEMLGNFSFGDYFKKEAIRFAWGFLTEELKIPKDKLYVTVFREDDEAENIWVTQEGVSKERISRFDEKDNFWMMGDTGPCGPCSEIFYDHGPKAGCGKPDCKVGCSCDRYVEIWNLVFMQFNQKPDGTREPLPRPSVDTGSGLERVAAVMQGVTNNYDTDLFQPLIQVAQSKQENTQFDKQELLAAYRVLADHARSTAFLIADGALPSNEGRGYVLRRIMRRAIRYGRKVTTKQSLLLPIVQKVIETMGDVYPELKTQKSVIENTVRSEEERFLNTLDQGTHILNEEMSKLVSQKKKVLPGDLVFKLYDTFGFPVDLTKLMAAEKNFEVDEKGFEEKMKQAKTKAKASWKSKGMTADAAHLIELAQKAKTTEFTGYEELSSQANVVLLSNGKEHVTSLSQGEKGLLVVDKTPFYAESGGQVGDRGFASSSDTQVKIENCTRQNDVFFHFIEVVEGSLKQGDEITLQVDDQERVSTARNHSATHLLHSALRKALGSHVTQAGSLVEAQRLRFDFTHPSPLTDEQIQQVEQLVNQEINRAQPVHHKVSSYDEAVQAGAMALFGEKYGEEVRHIRMGEFSHELCGGTHVHNTSEMRLFKIVSESSVSAGVRRIEAVTGEVAFQYLDFLAKESLRLRNIAHMVEPWTRFVQAEEQAPSDLAFWAERRNEEIKKLEREVKKLKGSQISVEQLIAEASQLKEGRLVYASLDIEERDVLSELSDKLKDKIQSGAVVLIGRGNPTHPIIVSVTKDLSKKYNAGKILQSVTSVLGGRGGGRPDFAQGAVQNLDKAEEGKRKLLESL